MSLSVLCPVRVEPHAKDMTKPVQAPSMNGSYQRNMVKRQTIRNSHFEIRGRVYDNNNNIRIPELVYHLLYQLTSFIGLKSMAWDRFYSEFVCLLVVS